MKSPQLGIRVPTVLLPNSSVDLTSWSVVACDQYTSQPQYWEQVSAKVGSNPSALHLIFPEVYLEEAGKEERIQRINQTMEDYLTKNVLASQPAGFVYIDRKTSHVPSRKGLVLCVDLEQYDYNKGSNSLIRASEGTIIDRLPPRIRVRENAAIESPHIMLLVDDPDRTVIEPLAVKTSQMKKLYDIELMMDGGHVTGYLVDDQQIIDEIFQAVANLAKPEVFQAKYGVGSEEDVLLFAVGDGNHSLATAKACWEKLKLSLSAEEAELHPARFALVELVNVYDEGLIFEPIHRVVFNVKPKEFIQLMLEEMSGQGLRTSLQEFESREALEQGLNASQGVVKVHRLPYCCSDGFGLLTVENPNSNLEVGTLQNCLDAVVQGLPQARIDYIHGQDVVDALAGQEGNLGFYLPPMDKHDLFKTVVLDGVLPRKTFSMGEADEKRFYLECRKIK